MSNTVKALIPALTSLWKAAGVPGLNVLDGPSDDPTARHLIVGWSGGQSPPITVTRVVGDAGLRHDRENYDVICLLSYWSGEAKTLADVRNLLLDALDVIDAALNANHTLGLPSVMHARISDYAIDPDVYETGDWVSAPITVHVEAWT